MQHGTVRRSDVITARSKGHPQSVAGDAVELVVHAPETHLDAQRFALTNESAQVFGIEAFLPPSPPGFLGEIGVAPTMQIQRENDVPKTHLGGKLDQGGQLPVIRFLHQRPHFRPDDTEAPGVIIQQPAVSDDMFELALPPDGLEGLLVRPVHRDIDLVDARIDQLPVIVPEMQQRGVGRHAHPYTLRTRVFDHLEIIIALHQGLAQAVQLDLDEPMLLVDDVPELVERHVPGALSFRHALTTHIVQAKLQRLTFSMSSLMGK